MSSVVAENKLFPSAKELYQMLVTFLFVTFAWIFFRAETLHHAIGYISCFVNDSIQHPMNLFSFSGGKQIFALVLPMVLGDWYMRHDERHLKSPAATWLRYSLYTVFTLAIAYCLISNYLNDQGQEFIYFQF